LAGYYRVTHADGTITIVGPDDTGWIGANGVVRPISDLDSRTQVQLNNQLLPIRARRLTVEGREPRRLFERRVLVQIIGDIVTQDAELEPLDVIRERLRTILLRSLPPKTNVPEAFAPFMERLRLAETYADMLEAARFIRREGGAYIRNLDVSQIEDS
jgi:hypothetical protein